MNKFTKLILTTAVFATGIMASESYVSGSLNVDGTINQNQNADVTGAITVNYGGVFNNNATLAFKDDGGLSIVGSSPLVLKDYQDANDAYSLGVIPVGQYPVERVIGTLSGSYVTPIPMAALQLKNISGLETGYELDTTNKLIRNIEVLTSDPTDSLPKKITWYYNEEGSRITANANITWEATPQTKEAFIAQVKAAIENSSAPKDEKTRLQNGLTLGGKFDNTGGILDFIEATGTNFSGAVSGGSVKLKDTTSATLTSLKVTGVNAEYEYASTDTYTAPTVDSSTQYITVTYTQGKTEGDAKTEFVNKFAGESTITKFSGTAYGEANDSRLTFPGILADQTLNKKGNKLKTEDIPNVVKDYNKGNGLDVNDTINIQFEGSDALQFSTGKADGSDQVIEFAGENSNFTGSASFADEITKVVANGEKTLPVKLASDMSNITLEINGTNAIDNSGETTVKNLKLNSDATLTIAAGTTLNIGENSLS